MAACAFFFVALASGRSFAVAVGFEFDLVWPPAFYAGAVDVALTSPPRICARQEQRTAEQFPQSESADERLVTTLEVSGPRGILGIGIGGVVGIF
jgi:hypothetical protein